MKEGITAGFGSIGGWSRQVLLEPESDVMDRGATAAFPALVLAPRGVDDGRFKRLQVGTGAVCVITVHPSLILSHAGDAQWPAARLSFRASHRFAHVTPRWAEPIHRDGAALHAGIVQYYEGF